MVDELRDIAEVDLNPVLAWEKGLAVAWMPASKAAGALTENGFEGRRDSRPYAEETTSI
ncbi:MAG: hypothetical protein ACLSAH_11610 [Bilophila wadsworthia]